MSLAERRRAALSAWTTFVEEGDRAASLVRPEILDSLDPLGRLAEPRRRRGAAGRRVRDPLVLAGLGAAGRRRARRGGACVVPPRTGTSCSPSPTRTPACCGPTAAG
ncbi:hypothetical protein [Nocardioides convexus]|uniref:hypothetical protein n=1 Tax=Nocardioides convexus TaxID=2712224 RepID=UPI0024181D99|nr:hypothetical protein [Nocardioides convexus]